MSGSVVDSEIENFYEDDHENNRLLQPLVPYSSTNQNLSVKTMQKLEPKKNSELPVEFLK